MRRFLWIFGLLTGLLLAGRSVSADGPVAKAPRPSGPIDPKSCVAADCHANVKNYKVVHGPVNVNACEACHKAADAAKHTFTLARDKKDICTFCHKMETAGMPVVHKPVTTGDCLGCHDPHGGKTTKFLQTKAGGMRELCTTCHKDVTGGKKNVHGPVAAGACEVCHAPHAGKFPKLLLAEGKALCLSCHKEMGEQLKTAKVVHKPVAGGECSQCHDPHASDFVMQTKAAPLQLCTSCHEHEKIKDAALSAKHKHPVVTQERACLNCHTPHGGAMARLLKSEPALVCLKCHDKPIDGTQGTSGRVVTAVAEVMDKKLMRHGPVNDGNCSGCHNVHGGDQPRFLVKAYPETFYQPFALDKYDLCFSCHDKQLVLAKEAQGLTGFRNGTQNLHFLHVNRTDKGRSCRACHETHASKQPVHLRESVPYGQWELPINFKKATDGGTCAPGCHQPFGYDRKTPIENHPEAATQPVSATKPAAP